MRAGELQGKDMPRTCKTLEKRAEKAEDWEGRTARCECRLAGRGSHSGCRADKRCIEMGPGR